MQNLSGNRWRDLLLHWRIITIVLHFLINSTRNIMKIIKAKKLAKQLPRTSEMVWSSIPESLQSRLTAFELAEVAKALNTHWQKAMAHSAAEIVADGYVWSERDQKLLDIQR